MVRNWVVAMFAVLLVGAVPSLAAAQEATVVAIGRVPPIVAPHDSSLTRSLFVSTIAMQALDVHSTLSAIHHGAVEANPIMSGVTRHPALFIATKAAAATAMIMAARRFGKHNKVAMIATLVGLNSAYAVVVSHNYALARQRR